MFRPLLLTESVVLVFEGAEGVPALNTDEAKVSQILRNLVANGLKFTERGEVRVSASYDGATGTVVFRVADTGIGIAAENQSIVFEEFGQVAHQLQRRARGTGLGLPLSRRLAELLGGTLTLQSESGAGSVFTVTLPANYVAARPAAPPVSWTVDADRLPVLTLEDAPARGAALRTDVEGLTVPAAAGTHPSPKPTLALDSVAPAAILLDLVLGDEAWDFLIRLKRDQRTRHVPVVVASVIDAGEKALALGADAFLVKPIQRATLVETLNGLHARMHPPIRVLVDRRRRVGALPGPTVPARAGIRSD